MKLVHYYSTIHLCPYSCRTSCPGWSPTGTITRSHRTSFLGERDIKTPQEKERKKGRLQAVLHGGFGPSADDHHGPELQLAEDMEYDYGFYSDNLTWNRSPEPGRSTCFRFCKVNNSDLLQGIHVFNENFRLLNHIVSLSA